MATSLQPARSTTTLKVAIYSQFVLVGIVTVLLGPILPSLIALWGLRDAQAGAFFTAQFLGGMSGSLLSGALLPRLGFPRLIAVGLLAMGLGVSTLGLGSWTYALMATFVYGAGTGFSIPASNSWIAESNPGHSAAALSLLNLAWGIGATLWPLLAGMALHRFSLKATLMAVGLAVGLMGLRFLLLHDSQQTASASHERITQIPPAPLDPVVVTVLAVLVFLYVGTETSIGGWIASYGKRMMSTQSANAAQIPSVFWAALLLGRATAPSFLRLLSEKRVQRLGLSATVLGTALLLAADHMTVLLGGAVLCGFGLAPIFPIVVAWMSRRIGSERPRITGALFAASSVGGAVIPWVIGMISSRTTSLRTGLVVTLLTTSILLILSLIFAGRLAAPRTRA